MTQMRHRGYQSITCFAARTERLRFAIDCTVLPELRPVSYRRRFAAEPPDVSVIEDRSPPRTNNGY